MLGKRTPLPVRFWAKVKKTDNCWLWTGAVEGGGYGNICVGGRFGRRVKAHRVSFELARGPIPDGLCVLHKCDVRNCVNPDHLFLGTLKDNAVDMTAKGRHCRADGEHNGRAKLTWIDARNIRETYSRGGISQPALARFYGVTHSLIGQITRGTIWRTDGV